MTSTVRGADTGQGPSHSRGQRHDLGHSHGHDHGHGPRAHVCGGPDHHRGDYTPQQRADLDLVLAFNRRMSDLIDAGHDVSAVESFLDPDPLRYMWVDEGGGRIGDLMAAAHLVLDQAPQHDGHLRAGTTTVGGSVDAARPSVAAGPDGTVLVAWIEWERDRGDVVRVVLQDAAGRSGTPVSVSGEVTDVFRPTAVVTTDGVPWVLWGRRVDGGVSVWATRWSATAGWSEPEPVSDTDHPSFNQEAVAHRDGSLEVVWQGRQGGRFAIFSRRWADGTWAPTEVVSAGVEANVWDPTLAVFDDGGAAYGWSEFVDGSYRVVVRRRTADGVLAEPRELTSGSDYALHPHLAVTRDQQLWCAFDVVTVVGHAGSGPTRLRPAAEVGVDPSLVEGVRPGGEHVPPELLPDVCSSIRVVAVTDTDVLEAPGVLADRLDVVPSGLPKLVATADGGLVVAYRVHRRLPLMTYYWEAATQVLAEGGWLPPTTYGGTDGTLEEVAVAAVGDGALVAAQTDGRLQVALEWTEGFGGRECPYLHEHHGEVVWHGVHGIGSVVLGRTASAGPAVSTAYTGTRAPRVRSADRPTARRWSEPDEPRGERYTVSAGGRDLTLYWGDLHRHSLVSRCTSGDEPSLEDFYRYAWDVCEYDFWAVTDHSENSSEHQWWSIQKIADLFHVDQRFVPLYGFEWTSADSGHQNVIYGDVARGAPIFSAFAEGTTDPAGLWQRMAEHPAYPAITIPHHPGSAMVYTDWDYHDPEYSRLVEVFQACRGNYEALGAFRQYSDATKEGTFVLDGLLRGHRFGFIASSDHGHGASYVGAYAASLDRAAVFDALRSRRTFAATTRDVLLDVRLGDHLMGEEVELDGPRTFTVHAEGYTEVARVDLLRDGDVVHSTGPGHPTPDGHLSLPLRLEWGGADETTRWDGRLTARDGAEVVQTPFWSPDVVEASPTEVAWASTTYSFGEPYGCQRGGVELTVVGPPEATLSVQVAGVEHDVTLAELRDGPVHAVPVPQGHLRLQPGTGGLIGLGTRALDLSWTDPAPPEDRTAFYYARVFLVDGEAAWSSPIWVSPATVR
ncbi:MAG: hypothetical protein AVDCRST_MAG36-2785 [uncultured Nocardioidaceae bacterium]|uniref:DUF3604 domain-containing protein n=1 Tax=uncultured Nocardioidaceae bacterium TaxID=253824 RepID=A0A6J4MP58_9ACTN|nr:MAG: hypothetical protein AVDCRST_MAG36-2785 [uncultured Nocardioidaceae bacterium]